MAENLVDIAKINTDNFSCSTKQDACSLKERTLSYALFVEIPAEPEPPEEVFKECCYSHIVVASTTDSSIEKNDFSSYYHRRQTSGETCEFVMIDMVTLTEYDLNNNTYGEFKNFNSVASQPDLTFFKLSWKKVIDTLGTGVYKVVKRINVAGLPIEIEYLVYNLKNYSDAIVDGTTRVDVTMSGLLEELKIDFTNTGYETSMRIPGFFGRREPKWEEDNLVDRGYNKRQISMKQTNEYKFQSMQIPDCLTKEIIDFMLYSDDIRIFDYNLNNHSYDYKNFPVKLENNEGTVYTHLSRKAQLNLLFGDKKLDKNKRNF